jgi:hypothetical protein
MSMNGEAERLAELNNLIWSPPEDWKNEVAIRTGALRRVFFKNSQAPTLHLGANFVPWHQL